MEDIRSLDLREDAAAGRENGREAFQRKAAVSMGSWAPGLFLG